MKNIKAFTLIELLVVISIIGLLSSVVLTSLNASRAKSRDSKRVQELVQLRNALELHRSKYGTFPHSYNVGKTEFVWYDSCQPTTYEVNTEGEGDGDGTWLPRISTLDNPPIISQLPVGVAPNLCHAYYSDGDAFAVLVDTETMCGASGSGKMCGVVTGDGSPTNIIMISTPNFNENLLESNPLISNFI